MNYQQLYVKGKTKGLAQRDCVARYEYIAHFCKQYKRPFTVFDLGCNMGYFGFRLADEFGCVSILGDTKPIGELCKQNTGRIIWLQHRFSVDDLEKLSMCEHFDVVLAYNVLHHFDNWKPAAEAVMKMADYVIAEIPARNDPGTKNAGIVAGMYDWFLKQGGELINEMPSHVSGKTRPTYLLKGSPGITMQTMDAQERKSPKCSVKVKSTFQEKTISITRTNAIEKREFIHGMNLWNAKRLGLRYPGYVGGLVSQTIKDMDGYHDDLQPWNFILDGAKVHPIDFNNKSWRTEPADGALYKCLEMLND